MHSEADFAKWVPEDAEGVLWDVVVIGTGAGGAPAGFKGKGGSMHLAVFSVGSLGESGIVGSLMPVAVGAGLSARLRKTDQVCLCFFGDGAANCGPFHEALNLASIWRLPVIFLCENNLYATFTPMAATTPIRHIAQRAESYNIPGLMVDGQDVIVVYQAVADAVLRARAGGGPVLIEAKTYRYCEHSEPDALGLEMPEYRSGEEISAWKERDPISIFSSKLLEMGSFTRKGLADFQSEVAAEIAEAVTYARNSPLPHPDALFEDLYL